MEEYKEEQNRASIAIYLVPNLSVPYRENDFQHKDIYQEKSFYS
jgi:hypothetical protein